MTSNYLEVFASSSNVLRSRVGISTMAGCVRVFSNIITLICSRSVLYKLYDT